MSEDRIVPLYVLIGPRSGEFRKLIKTEFEQGTEAETEIGYATYNYATGELVWSKTEVE